MSDLNFKLLFDFATSYLNTSPLSRNHRLLTQNQFRFEHSIKMVDCPTPIVRVRGDSPGKAFYTLI